MYADDMGKQVEATHFCIHACFSTPRRQQSRAEIPTPEVAPGANSWESGRTVQTRLAEMDFNW